MTASNTVPLFDARSLSRRDFIKLTSASLALAGVAACSRAPQETIVSSVHDRAGRTPGLPIHYATAHVHGGYATGVLVQTQDGRPTKVEGNLRHPASLGATDIFAQASVLELWDPARSQTVLRRGEAASWDLFTRELSDALRGAQPRDGDGIRILTRTVTSPTLAAQMIALRERFPKAHWHVHEPWSRDAAFDGARRAFGRALEPRYDFARADVIVALDADFLFEPPGRVRYAHDFAMRRAPPGTARLYAFEPATTLTGARADHRVAVRVSQVAAVARAVARAVGIDLPKDQPDAGSPIDARVIAAIARDLSSGPSLVIAGDRQTAAVHALVHAINHKLGNTGRSVAWMRPIAASHDAEPLAALVDALNADDVDALIVLDGNPAFDAPAGLDVARAIGRARWSVHAGPYADETSTTTRWHVPLAHAMETWSDARAYDGTTTILQPLIAPLYGGRSAHELLDLAIGGARSSHAIVRASWSERRHDSASDFDAFWRASLHAGLVDGSAAPTERVALDASHAVDSADAPSSALEIAYAPDPSTWDGRYAGNPWLQELPRPFSKITWDNAALVGAGFAGRHQIVNGDRIDLRVDERTLTVPVWIDDGHVDDAITLHLGNGARTRLADAPIGFDAQRLRSRAGEAFAAATAWHNVAGVHAFASTQSHHRMEGRDLARAMTLDDFRAGVGLPHAEERRSLYPDVRYEGYRWGMAIDLNACIGCNACTIACQAENNIPVVGREEVARGREMHWIRVDHYVDGPVTHAQPVPCMQCENAPCEVVCPVEASVHDDEGINVQVYNRCIGTRFCSNNCPYKVRRFNWFEYSSDEPALMAQKNPEVTVRSRGVMEKCNYCLQRIANGRIDAEKEGRRIRDGEVVSACMAVCPTRAIVFGDLNDPDSAVVRAKRDPRDYALLEELNTRPRTTYAVRVLNTNPEIDRG